MKCIARFGKRGDGGNGRLLQEALLLIETRNDVETGAIGSALRLLRDNDHIHHTSIGQSRFDNDLLLTHFLALGTNAERGFGNALKQRLVFLVVTAEDCHYVVHQ